jgi:hypothetical protein
LILENSQEFGAFKNQLGSLYIAPNVKNAKDLLEKNALNLEDFGVGGVKIAIFRQWVFFSRSPKYYRRILKVLYSPLWPATKIG